MKTWQLWRALQKPPIGHPLFRRLYYERNRVALDRVRFSLWAGTAALVMGAIVIFPMLMFFVVMLGPLVYALLMTLYYGALWTVDIAGTVARELSQHIHDLQCMMPIGALGTNWIAVSGRLHYKEGMRRSMQEIQAVMQLFAFVVAFILFGTVISPPAERGQLLFVTVIVLAVMVFIYIDHIQSTLCCALIGLLAARQTRTTNDARLWSLILFVALQLGWYLGLGLLILLVLPFAFDLFDITSLWVNLLTPIAVVALDFMLREGLIRLLWAKVLSNMNADQSELQQLQGYLEWTI